MRSDNIREVEVIQLNLSAAKEKTQEQERLTQSVIPISLGG